MANHGAYLHGKFVWFEHHSADPDRAMAFYDALFGWRSEPVSFGSDLYRMIHLGEQAIGGYREGPAEERSHWLSYLSVADLDVSFRGAVASGAQVLVPPADFGPVGRGATIADPSGAVLALWKDAKGDRPDAERTAMGDWFWNECWTPDERKSLAFYETIFGFRHESMDMGPAGSSMGTYHILEKDGKPRAGLARAVRPDAPAMWLPYVAVPDCDATAAKVGSLGGEVLTAPRDIPDVGRFAIAADPLGAAIGFIAPAEAK